MNRAETTAANVDCAPMTVASRDAAFALLADFPGEDAR